MQFSWGLHISVDLDLDTLHYEAETEEVHVENLLTKNDHCIEEENIYWYFIIRSTKISIVRLLEVKNDAGERHLE
jgi:hypothetical protein